MEPLTEQHAQRTTLQWRFPSPAGQLTVSGVSRAAWHTALFVHELGWALDAGAKISTALPELTFLTHSHADHTQMLGHLTSRHQRTTFIMHEETTPYVLRYFKAIQALNDHDLEWAEKSPCYEAVIGLQPGDTYEIQRGKQRYRARLVGCDHTVPCLGYQFFELRDCLKPELAGLEGKQLAELRKRGESITELRERPLFAFLGDTTPEVFSRHPELLSMPYVFTECTFIAPEHAELAAEAGHSSWSRLSPIIAESPETNFILMHLSPRYDEAEVEAWRQDLPENAMAWVS